MKKVIALILASLMLVSMLAACRSDTPAESGSNTPPVNQPPPEAVNTAPPIEVPEEIQEYVPHVDPHPSGIELGPDDPFTITMLIATDELAPAPNNRMVTLMREKLGVTIEYEIVPLSLQDQRIGLLLAGDTLPDIIALNETEARATEGGALLRLNEYLATGKWPNVYEHVAPYVNELSWKGGGVETGLYTLPNFNRYYGDPPMMSPEAFSAAGFYIQKAVLEYLDYPDLSNMTLEKYFGMLEEYYTAHPTIDGMPTIPYTILAQGKSWGMTNPPLHLMGYPNEGGVWVDDDGNAHVYAGTEADKRYFKFLNQMYHRGLLDPEAFTHDTDMYNEKIANGRVLGMFDQRWSYGNAHDSLVNQNRHERTYVATMPTYDGIKPHYADRDVMNVYQGFSISATAADPERLLTFIDVILSEEWQILLSWGEKDIDYFVDENGLFYRNQDQRDNRNDITWKNNNRLEAFFYQMPKRQGTLSCGNAFGPGEQPSEFQLTLSDYDKNFLATYDAKHNLGTWRAFYGSIPDNKPWYPAWNITLGFRTEASNAFNQLRDAAFQFVPAAVMAPEDQFDSIWDDYVAQLGRINIQAYEDHLSAVCKARIAAVQG